VPLDGVEVSLQAGLVKISGPVLANGLGESFLTSDLGEWVNDRLEILGRADRVIISGGLKLSLDHFEQRALELTGVDQLVAVALDSEFGQSVGVLYVGIESVDFATLEESISLAARPRRVVRVDSIPMLPSGKPDLLAARRVLES
jgi:O-succinylbenzoic acid--CoA ligase